MSAWNATHTGQDYEFSQVTGDLRWRSMRDRGINQRITKLMSPIGWDILPGYSMENYGQEKRANRGAR